MAGGCREIRFPAKTCRVVKYMRSPSEKTLAGRSLLDKTRILPFGRDIGYATKEGVLKSHFILLGHPQVICEHALPGARIPAVFDFSSFLLFFQNVLWGGHRPDTSQALRHLRGCIHSCCTSIQEEPLP